MSDERGEERYAHVCMWHAMSFCDLQQLRSVCKNRDMLQFNVGSCPAGPRIAAASGVRALFLLMECDIHSMHVMQCEWLAKQKREWENGLHFGQPQKEDGRGGERQREREREVMDCRKL